jgi:hypothetical protein
VIFRKESPEMISSRSRLASTLILTCICIPALCQDANDHETQLKFEVSQEERPWVRDHDNRPGRGPIAPKYVAEFFRQSADYPAGDGHLSDAKHLLETRAGSLVSPRQREFMMASDALANMGFGRTVKNHRHFGVYAVSQGDAKRVTEGLLELWAAAAKRKAQEAEDSFREQDEAMARANNELQNKQAELDNVTRQLEQLRASTRSLAADQDAREQAKATVLEMDNILNMLNIEITGIKARLTAIDHYKSEKKLTSIEGLAKLEVMLAEQTVELAGALAKMEAARGIRVAHQKLYDLVTRRTTLESEISTLRSDLGKWPVRRQYWEERLTNPPAYWLPPKVFQNKVTIYPVRVEE